MEKTINFQEFGIDPTWDNAELQEYLKLKRRLDIFFASVLLFLAFPVMLLTAIVIWLGSKGPIFIQQERVGLYGEIFLMWKFRTMYVRPPEEEGPLDQVAKNDKRLVPLGALIRMLRMDELAQLINVFRGTMSMVGPRARLVDVDRKLLHTDVSYVAKYAVKPGITGESQTHVGRASTPEQERETIRMDREYPEKMCLNFDLQILLNTVAVVLLAKGA